MLTQLRSLLVTLVLASAAAATPACRSTPEITAENIADRWALTEQHEPGSVVMTVAADGKATVLVKDRDGKPIEEGVSGTLTVKAPGEDGAPVTAELVPVPRSGGVLTAAIPKLEGDLTEIGYELKVNGAPIQGVVHVPRGGTQELHESAKANNDPALEGKKGPNGGVLQRVGDDVVEIIADQKTGELRVYVLNLDLKPVPIGEREIKLAVNTGPKAEVLVLAPGPDRLYFTGKLSVKVNPTKLTVVLTNQGHTDVVLCGYRPGGVVVLGPAAPAIAILAVTTWSVVNVKVNARPTVVVHDDDDDDGRIIVVRKGKGKGKGKWRFKRW